MFLMEWNMFYFSQLDRDPPLPLPPTSNSLPNIPHMRRSNKLPNQKQQLAASSYVCRGRGVLTCKSLETRISLSWAQARATLGETGYGCRNHGSWLVFVIASYLHYLKLQMCEKSLGLSSLNKMAAAAASMQDLTVVLVLVASLFLHALGDII